MTVDRIQKSPQQSGATALASFRLLYGIYAMVLFLVLGLCTLLLLLAVPGVLRRRAVARGMARTFFALAGMPVTVKGLEGLPPGQCVVVSNHASYLDGVVFTAALPARFAFVIKREMNGVPLAGLLLRRLGSHFVERFNRHRGAADARRVLRDAINGNSLAFFPEGTFTPTPGLLKSPYARCLYHRDSRELSDRARDGARNACGAVTERGPAPTPTHRGPDSGSHPGALPGRRRRRDRASRSRTGHDPGRARGARPHMFRRDCPPTSYRAREICPSEQTLTDSMSSANTLPPLAAASCSFFKAAGEPAALRAWKARTALT